MGLSLGAPDAHCNPCVAKAILAVDEVLNNGMNAMSDAVVKVLNSGFDAYDQLGGLSAEIRTWAPEMLSSALSSFVVIPVEVSDAVRGTLNR